MDSRRAKQLAGLTSLVVEDSAEKTLSYSLKVTIGDRSNKEAPALVTQMVRKELGKLSALASKKLKADVSVSLYHNYGGTNGDPLISASTGGKEVSEAATENEVPHFGIQDDGNAGKVAVALAKAGLTVDMEHAMGIHYFNFKDQKSCAKAHAIANKVIDKSKEQE
jgi:hypothetical protein